MPAASRFTISSPGSLAFKRCCTSFRCLRFSLRPLRNRSKVDCLRFAMAYFHGQGLRSRRHEFCLQTLSWSESGRFLAVDHPRYAEPVHEHAKPWRPECRPERHVHVSIFSQGQKDPFALRQVLKADVHVEALWF